MSMTVSAALGQSLVEELTKSFGRIRHCLDQLSDQQVWQRPAESMNAIGNLILHLCGNLGQYIVSGVGGAPDTRDRPAEFAARGPMSRGQLLGKLEVVVADARAAIERQSEGDWVKSRRIQGFEMNGVAAALRAVSHFHGHEQEIIHMTRALLGDTYRFHFVPATKEQGAKE